MLNLLYIVIHSMICLVLILLVLIQQGKGAATAFGAGASSTVFGSKGSNAFTVKATALLAFMFFFSTISLNYSNQKQKNESSVVNVLTSGAKDSSAKKK